MSEIELKACPFCGGRDIRDFGGLAWSRIPECRDCLARAHGPFSEGTRHPVDVWNTRAPQWQPIESAPKDGTAVLATSAHMTGPNGEPVAWAAVFDQERGRWIATWDGEPLNDATHWQPLPAPPEVEG